MALVPAFTCGLNRAFLDILTVLSLGYPRETTLERRPSSRARSLASSVASSIHHTRYTAAAVATAASSCPYIRASVLCAPSLHNTGSVKAPFTRFVYARFGHDSAFVFIARPDLAPQALTTRRAIAGWRPWIPKGRAEAVIINIHITCSRLFTVPSYTTTFYHA